MSAHSYFLQQLHKVRRRHAPRARGPSPVPPRPPALCCGLPILALPACPAPHPTPPHPTAQVKRVQPYVVHLTWTYNGMDGKRARMRDMGLWVDPPAYYGDPAGSFVTVDLSGLPQARRGCGQRAAAQACRCRCATAGWAGCRPVRRGAPRCSSLPACRPRPASTRGMRTRTSFLSTWPPSTPSCSRRMWAWRWRWRRAAPSSCRRHALRRGLTCQLGRGQGMQAQGCRDAESWWDSRSAAARSAPRLLPTPHPSPACRSSSATAKRSGMAWCGAVWWTPKTCPSQCPGEAYLCAQGGAPSVHRQSQRGVLCTGRPDLAQPRGSAPHPCARLAPSRPQPPGLSVPAWQLCG